MLGVGWWVGQEIEAGILNRVAATTALYVDSFVGPELQGLAESDTVSVEHTAKLDALFQNTALGHTVLAIKVWRVRGDTGQVIYGSDPRNVGLTFPVRGELASAWNGQVVGSISDLSDVENAQERPLASRLIEIYSPVFGDRDHRVIAVAEFYQSVEGLEDEIAGAKRRSWLAVGGAAALVYLLLIGMVRGASDTIQQQQSELSDKVERLTTIMSQNDELSQRVRRAGARTVELNELFLRRISAELHDGPAQDLGLALLQLDSAGSHHRASDDESQAGEWAKRSGLTAPATVRASLQRALQEIRATSTGLRLPELDDLSLQETFRRVTTIHERRTGSEVTLLLDDLPDEVPLPVRITVYRLAQEALSNSFRHGGGVGQTISATADGSTLCLEIRDSGPGFDQAEAIGREGHLGLQAMRERVEILGGQFEIESPLGHGTRIRALIPLCPGEIEAGEIEE